MEVEDLDTLLRAARILAGAGHATLSRELEHVIRSESIQTANPR